VDLALQSDLCDELSLTKKRLTKTTEELAYALTENVSLYLIDFNILTLLI
jgi:hypothetical protein